MRLFDDFGVCAVVSRGDDIDSWLSAKGGRSKPRRVLHAAWQ